MSWWWQWISFERTGEMVQLLYKWENLGFGSPAPATEMLAGMSVRLGGEDEISEARWPDQPNPWVLGQRHKAEGNWGRHLTSACTQQTCTHTGIQTHEHAHIPQHMHKSKTRNSILLPRSFPIRKELERNEHLQVLMGQTEGLCWQRTAYPSP